MSASYFFAIRSLLGLISNFVFSSKKKAAYNFTPLPHTPQITQNEFIITNVIPGDFNYDGRLDVLIMGQKDTTIVNSEILMRVYLGNGNDSFGL